MPSQRESMASEGKPALSSDSLRQRLQESYQKGKQLSAEKNFDYAHELFAQCIARDPNNVPFVEAMLANLRAKFNGDKKNVSFALGWGSSRPLTKAITIKNWPEALRLGIEQLKRDPWHVPTLQSIAVVCAAQHHNEVELVYLKQALDANPKDAEVNRHCARSLGRMGQFDQAIACWHRVEILRGKDAEATQMISRLAEEKLRYPNGRPPAADASAPAAVKKQPEPAEKPRDVVLSPRQRLQQAIKDDPSNIALYIELAELSINARRWDDAEQTLQRCLAACGDALEVREQLERVRSLRLASQQQEAAARQPQEDPSTPLPWLEMGLVCAAVLLVFQLAPGLLASITNLLTSNWKALLLVANILFVPFLFFLRSWLQRSTEQSLH